MRRSNRGFTLIEIMIVIAIIGIVITIGYPSLTEYVKKGRRTEVAGLLSEQAQILERFYSKNNVYTDATGLSAGNDYYTITPTLTDQTFLLTAMRKAGTPWRLTSVAISPSPTPVSEAWSMRRPG